MKKIFTISGKAQHGKDSVAVILNHALSPSIVLHFADTLKFCAEKYFGWDGQKTGRQRDLLQWLGTDRVRKELGWADYWAERTCDVIEILYDKFDYFIVADCRFPNEISYPAERFSRIPVIPVKVVRLDFDNGLSEDQKNHESETALDSAYFKYVIESKSGLDNLEVATLEFLERIREDFSEK